MEEGKVAEWEAPCHQYALMMVGGEEQLMMVERGGEWGVWVWQEHQSGWKKHHRHRNEEQWRDESGGGRVGNQPGSFLVFLIDGFSSVHHQLISSLLQVESVFSSWKYREKAGHESTVRMMLEDMVTKQRFEIMIIMMIIKSKDLGHIFIFLLSLP